MRAFMRNAKIVNFHAGTWRELIHAERKLIHAEKTTQTVHSHSGHKLHSWHNLRSLTLQVGLAANAVCLRFVLFKSQRYLGNIF